MMSGGIPGQMLHKDWTMNADSHSVTELKDPGGHHASQIFLPKYLKEKGR